MTVKESEDDLKIVEKELKRIEETKPPKEVLTFVACCMCVVFMLHGVACALHLCCMMLHVHCVYVA